MPKTTMIDQRSGRSTHRRHEESGEATGQPARRKLRVCMVAYAFYESDTRILQYATALAERGDSVDVIALKHSSESPAQEVLHGVNVYRVQSRAVNEKGLLTYVYRIGGFLLRSAVFLRKKHLRQPYDVIHVHNVPDCLVFSAITPKLKRVPVILDIHDLLPEFYASKFRAGPRSLLFRLMTCVERASVAFSTHVIIANHLWRDRLVSRSCLAGKCSVVRNHPDLGIFVAAAGRVRGNSEKFVLTYPGSLNGHQGLDVAIKAFAAVAGQIPEAEFHIYGEGPAKPSLIELANELGLAERVKFHAFLPSREIARIMAGTDLAIEPKRATSAFGNEALSTKILEFMALGVPVIASRTAIHAYYYDDSMVQYYDNDDPAGLAAQIVRLRNDVALRQLLVKNARRYVEENHWDARKGAYLDLVDSLDRTAKARSK